MYTVRYKSHHDASSALKKRYTADMVPKPYVEEMLNKPAQSRRVIYLHVPFCNKICSFCPFHRPDELKRREYHGYLIDEIHRISDYPYMQAPIDAINFGGGTPTALAPEQMDAVLSELHRCFSIAPGAEISVESSATELTLEMLEVLKRGGVNRLSIGVQTFDDKGRHLLGRRGSGEHAASRVKQAIDSGIVNTSIDLIYHYPGETMETLERDLAVIRSLGIAGISFYSLILHEKTPLFRRLDENARAALLSVKAEYEMFMAILHTLGKSGFAPLELTKLVRSGMDRYDYMRIRHSGGSCIAIGHGAGGNLENYLYHNSATVPLLSEAAPVSRAGRVVQPVYRLLDELIYELQKGGADLSLWSERLQRNLLKEWEPSLERMQKEGLLILENGRISLTESGLFWGNNMIDEWMRLL